MKRKFYKELWGMRFKKMLTLEKDSVVAYSSMLKECKKKHQMDSIIPHLERLVADEKRHALLCKELCAILERQPE